MVRKYIKKGYSPWNLDGDLKTETVQMVYEDNIKKYGTLTCYLCLKSIEFGQDSLEHKTPLSRNGNNDYNNLSVAHLKCNLKKGKKTEEEFRNYLLTKCPDNPIGTLVTKG